MSFLVEKQKTGHTLDNNVHVFQSPGLQPDTRFTVFGTQFHTHSIFLKLHSAFFRAFLDSPDKTVVERDPYMVFGLRTPTTTFTYEWITLVDEDGTWHVVASENVPASCGAKQYIFNGDKEIEIKAFKALLCAIHVHHYEIKDRGVLTALIELADYYLALPIVSRSLNSIILSRPPIFNTPTAICVKLFPIAYKLRHAILFRESLIFLMGPFKSPCFRQVKDPYLYKIAESFYNKLSAQVLNVQCAIMSICMADGDGSALKELLNQAMKDSYCEKAQMIELPRYFRRLFAGGVILPLDLREKLENLLKNTCVLKPLLISGTSALSDHFLGLEVADEDLPWDLEEVDW